MPSAGTLLDGRYRLEQLLGGGTMGQVWRARDESLGRRVAVKLLRPEWLSEAQARKRFQREAVVLATLRHPNIVTVHGSGYCDPGDGEERAYLVMEYVDGRSLRAVLDQEGTLPAEAASRIVADVAAALAAAHAQEVVHRDVKASNVLVTGDGHAVLADFGVAHSAALSSITSTGALIGTLAYLAPELARGESPRPASDLYSLGILAYECLAGRLPFTGDSAFELMHKHLNEDPPALAPEIPAHTRELVVRALRKDPADRWPDGAAMASAARGMEATLPQPPSPAVPGNPARPRRRPPFSALFLPAFAVALVTGISLTLWLVPWDGPAAPAGTVTGGPAALPASLAPEGSASPAPKGTVSPSAPPSPHATRTAGQVPAPRTSAAHPARTTPKASSLATVPAVVNLARATAKARIRAAGLVPDVQAQSGWYFGSGTCVVYTQSPAAGTKVKKGSSVTIYASAFVTSADGSCD